MKIGVLGTADIAFRRFLPALRKCRNVSCAGVASRTVEKAARFVETFGGQAYPSYDALLADEGIDAVYVPLPPALHYEWGKRVLEAGKHLLMEKPFTTCLEDTKTLLALAEEKGLAVHENYMFLYHSQLEKIKELLVDGTLGELRLIRTAFGFPKRGGDDFRYQKSMGGGTLLDCGGYPVRLALELLGESARVTQARLVQPEGYEVDLFGSAVLENADGLCAQISFGMDNSYKCELELWGNKGCLTASRIFTAPEEYQPEVEIQTQSSREQLRLPADNSFTGSIARFVELVGTGKAEREIAEHEILLQAAFISAIQKEGL